MCLELLKVVAALPLPGEGRTQAQGDHDASAIARFRNGFVNLALPSLSFAEPVPAERFSVRAPGGEREYSVWDTLPAPGPLRTLTVRALQRHLLQQLGARLQSVSLGDRLLYADFMDDGERRLDAPLQRLLAEEDGAEGDERGAGAAGIPVPTEGFVDLDVLCVDGDGEDVRLPPVRVDCGPEAPGEVRGGRTLLAGARRLFAKKQR